MTSTPLTGLRSKTTLFAVPLLIAIALLSACGGGGGGGAGGGAGDVADDAAASGLTLTGVVAVGAPLVDAKVEGWCGDGTQAGSAMTNDKGQYEMKMPEDCQAPVLLQATEDQPSGSTLFSYLDQFTGQGSQSTIQLNITTLTDLFTKMTLGDGDREALLAKLLMLATDPAFQEQVTQKQQETVKLINGWQRMFEAVTARTLLQQPFDPRPGDPMDDVLEALATLRGTVRTDSLIEQAELRGGDLASGQPWKTVFGGATTLTLSATACVSSGVPADPATATLHMQDKNLEVTLASSLFAAPVTFTVGPAARSDFQMILNGDSPLVRLRASAGGAMVDLFTLAGAPMIAFSVSGTSVSCTLSNPVRRADLVAFHPATRIRSVIPASGASGNCAASAAGPAYGYAVSSLGDVRFDGTSIPADWLDAAHAYYSESLQYGMGGPGPSYQVQLAALPTGQGIQGYYFSTVPYGMNCTSSNP